MQDKNYTRGKKNLKLYAVVVMIEKGILRSEGL